MNLSHFYFIIFLVCSFSLTKKNQKVKTKRSATHKPLCSAFGRAHARFSNYDSYVNSGLVSTNGANQKFSGQSRAVCAPRKALGWRSWWLFAILFCGRKKYYIKNPITILNSFLIRF